MLIIKPKSEKLKSKSQLIKAFKTSLLIAISISSFILIGVSLFIANRQSRPKFQFPNQLALSGWKLQSSNDLDNALKDTFKNSAIASRQYFYTSPSQDILRIDALYIEGISAIPQYLSKLGLNQSNQKLNIRYLESVGYYALFADQDRVYLSSCINARGMTAITEEQFTNNYQVDYQNLRHMSLYLLGMRDLRDNRCLLTTISIKLDKLEKNKLEQSYQILEKTWTNWYQIWKNSLQQN